MRFYSLKKKKKERKKIEAYQNWDFPNSLLATVSFIFPFFIFFPSFLSFSLSCEPWSIVVQASQECMRRPDELPTSLNLNDPNLSLRQLLTRLEWRAWAHRLVSFPMCFLYRCLSSPATNHYGLLGSSSSSRPCPSWTMKCNFSSAP